MDRNARPESNDFSAKLRRKRQTIMPYSTEQAQLKQSLAKASVEKRMKQTLDRANCLGSFVTMPSFSSRRSSHSTKRASHASSN